MSTRSLTGQVEHREELMKKQKETSEREIEFEWKPTPITLKSPGEIFVEGQRVKYELSALPSTTHEEDETLDMLVEVYHVASGGGGSGGASLKPNILAYFSSPMANTVLHVAAFCGNDGDVVDRAVKENTNLLFFLNKNNETPFHIAARAGHISTLRRLLECLCASFGDERDIYKVMGQKNDEGNNFLHEAMMSGSSSSNMVGSMVFPILEAYYNKHQSGDVNKGEMLGRFNELALGEVNKEDQSVLYLAVEAGLVENVNLFLDKCPKTTTPTGISPFLAAIMKRDQDMLTILVSKKKEWMHLHDMDLRLPIHWAASTGYLGGVVYLLDTCKTCSIQRDKKGFLPIHLAAHEGHVEVVKELLGYCPSHNEMLDLSGRNILHIAAKSGKLDLVRYILQCPTLEKMINQKTLLGETPLHLATTSCRAKIVYALTWDQRVDLNLVNKEKKTTLDLAIENDISYIETPSFRRFLTWVALKSSGAKRSLTKVARPATEQSVSTGIEQYKDRVDSLSVISTLIVTASVAAVFAIPGGGDGTATNLHKTMFHFFIFCITISLFSSVSVTIILIWGKMGLIELLNFSIKFASPLLGAALITLCLAFLAGIYTVISKLTWLPTIFVVITSIFVVMLVVWYALLYLPSSSTSMVWRYISYYPFIYMASLAESDDHENHDHKWDRGSSTVTSSRACLRRWAPSCLWSVFG